MGSAELFLHSPSASSGRLMLRCRGSCLVIATRRLLPREGVGSTCLRLRRFRPGGVPCRDLSSPPPAVTHAPGNAVPARPAAASRCSLAHDSFCLPRFRPNDSGGNAPAVRCCRSVGVNRPGFVPCRWRKSPGTAHSKEKPSNCRTTKRNTQNPSQFTR